MPSTDNQTAESPEKLVGQYKAWNQEISDALKREEKYRKAGKSYVEIYEGRKADEVPFAILYSNTETLLPAVYNSRPIPIVKRRFKDPDPIGKAVSEVSTRVLKFLIDSESEDYDNFDDLMVSAALEAILVNRGLTRFKFVGSDNHECVYGEAVRWDKFFHGYARTWKKVPWVGFEWDMSEQELKTNFPGIPFDFKLGSSGSEEEDNSGETKEEQSGVKTYKVFEIWDKVSKQVKFFSPLWPKGPLKVVPDPLNLLGFFPCPKPMNFMKKVSTLVPTPLYTQYKQQAKELNDITLRLKHIIKAVKVRGAYNSTIEGIEKMLEAGDNELVPVQNMESMPDNAGIDRALFVMPITDLVSAAQSLYVQREQVKQTIYEITGISDILRGASVASETATAQNIKNQWGTLRLKRAQKEVQRYCRDSLSIMLEIASKNFEQTTFQRMTGLPFLTDQQKAGIKAQIQMQQQQATMQQPMPGQEQQPPAQQLQIPAEIQEALQAPSWEDLLKTMHDQLSMAYKIDIETNSTIDAEAAQDKQDIGELLNGISQFLNGIAPLVEKGLLSMDVAKSMLLTITRRFNFGDNLEDALEKMQPPQPQQQGPDPAEQAKMALVKAETEAKMAELKQKGELEALTHQQKMQELQANAKFMEMELQIKEQELQLQVTAVQMKVQQQQAQHRMKMEQMAAKSKADEAKEKESAHANV